MIKNNKAGFIPSPYQTVTEYEDEFVKKFNNNLAEAVAEVLKYMAKVTASAIKDNNVILKGETTDIHEAEKEVDIHPTEAQIKAGNYKHGHFTAQGLDITIENPKGSIRSGVDKDGNKWSVKMACTYGYFKGTHGKDGDHVDVFIGDNLESERVYVVDQFLEGKFDEHKVMFGFDTLKEAKEAYLANYCKGWKGLKHITGIGIKEFKSWLGVKTKKQKPFRDYEINKAEEMTLQKAHVEGDIHPNGKWAWTQLPSGKYDWRGIKGATASKPKEPTFEEKYPGNASASDIGYNIFAFKNSKGLALANKMQITNVTDKNIMYELLSHTGRFLRGNNRISIDEFLKNLGDDKYHYSILPKLSKALEKQRFSDSDLMKNLKTGLKKQTEALKDKYIEQTKDYRRKEFDNVMNKFGSWTDADWKAEYPHPTWDNFLSRKGERIKSFYLNLKREGKDKYVEQHAKLAEEHYQYTIDRLADNITENGFDLGKVKLSSSSIGVNFETEVTDGTRYMRAYTIIASGPVIAPHYRYLFTNQRKK